jgi:prepilin peptidase CpaA
VAPAIEWTVVCGLAIVAAVCDVRTGRVPNVLTFGAAAAGLVMSVVLPGPGGLSAGLLGCVVGLALFFPLFALGGMGAGDVKLLAAFGAWLGPVDVLWAAIWASLVGGGLAVVVGAWRGYLSEAVRNLVTMAAIWHAGGASPTAGLTLGESRGPRLAYAVPIGIGAVLALWLGRA